MVIMKKRWWYALCDLSKLTDPGRSSSIVRHYLCFFCSYFSEAAVHRCNIKRLFWKSGKFHMKTLVLEYICDKVAGLHPVNWLKKRLQHGVIPVNFAKCFRILDGCYSFFTSRFFEYFSFSVLKLFVARKFVFHSQYSFHESFQVRFIKCIESSIELINIGLFKQASFVSLFLKIMN